MCRIAYLNPRAARLLDEAGELESFFAYLERSNGGHGNGVALVYRGGRVRVEKGVKLETDDIAGIVAREAKGDGLKHVLFHTRLASAGGIRDELTHPITDSQGRVVLVQNGHEAWYMAVAKYLGLDVGDSVSDTVVLAEMASVLLSKHGERGLERFVDFLDFSNVFLVWRDRVYFAKKKADLQVWRGPRRELVVASEGADVLVDMFGGRAFEIKHGSWGRIDRGWMVFYDGGLGREIRGLGVGSFRRRLVVNSPVNCGAGGCGVVEIDEFAGLGRIDWRDVNDRYLVDDGDYLWAYDRDSGEWVWRGEDDDVDWGDWW